MPELFGAPLGIMAKQEYQTQGLQAKKLMGDIAMQPSDMQYKQSLARVHMAEAEEKEASAAAARRLYEVESQFMEQEAGARKQLADAGKAQGQVITVADLPASGSVVRASGADALEKMVAFSEGKLPPSALAGYRKQIAEIHQKEAAQSASGAKAALDGTKAQVAQFEQIGNIAGAAALNPQNYSAIMLDPKTRGLLPQELTGNYRVDAPVLKAIEQASQDSIKRAKQALDVKDSDSKERLRNAQISKTGAQLELINARKTALKEDRTLRAKYGGSTSQEAADLKKVQAALAKARLEALNQKTAPPMPLDPTLVEVGKIYTGAGGVKYDIIGLDAKGNPIGRVHVQGAYTAPVAGTGPDLTADDGLEGDDLGD